MSVLGSLTNRIFVGLYSIIGELRATADWMAMFQEDRLAAALTAEGSSE